MSSCRERTKSEFQQAHAATISMHSILCLGCGVGGRRKQAGYHSSGRRPLCFASGCVVSALRGLRLAGREARLHHSLSAVPCYLARVFVSLVSLVAGVTALHAQSRTLINDTFGDGDRTTQQSRQVGQQIFQCRSHHHFGRRRGQVHEGPVEIEEHGAVGPG